MTVAAMISLDSRVVRQGEPLTSQVDDDLVLFSPDKGMYYGTQAVGRRIWSLLAEETGVEELCDRLLQEFDVDRTTCHDEVVAFLDSLAAEQLIRVR